MGQKSLLYATSLLNLTYHAISLLPNWQEIWKDLSNKVAPLIESGVIIGFDLGDELVWNCFPPDEMHTYASAIRATFPGAVIWANEATPVFSQNRSMCGPVQYSIPHAISWFSIDMYHLSGPDKTFVADWVKPFYEEYIFPQLDFSRQKGAVVPGSFGSNVNPQCDVDCYVALCSLDAENFVDWALSDPRLEAILPWHWHNDPSCKASQDEIGTKELPKLLETWKELAKKLQ